MTIMMLMLMIMVGITNSKVFDTGTDIDGDDTDDDIGDRKKQRSSCKTKETNIFSNDCLDKV